MRSFDRMTPAIYMHGTHWCAVWGYTGVTMAQSCPVCGNGQ